MIARHHDHRGWFLLPESISHGTRATDTASRITGVATSPVKVRVDSVDLLRGLIMVIMMLDHTRDFVHRDALAFDAANVARTFPALFFTRWITHFCAPLFVFLAGTSVCFQEMRGKSKAQLSTFLVTRGLWLVAIELVVLRPLIFFNFHYSELLAFFQVIWVIGWSMVVLAAAIHLPFRWLVALSLATIALHNTLDGFRVTGFNGPGTPVPGFGASIWMILHQQGAIFPFGFPGPLVFVVYPFVPWPAVMAAGYAWLERTSTTNLNGGDCFFGWVRRSLSASSSFGRSTSTAIPPRGRLGSAGSKRSCRSWRPRNIRHLSSI
jgi:uncharacterized membrane protein